MTSTVDHTIPKKHRFVVLWMLLLVLSAMIVFSGCATRPDTVSKGETVLPPPQPPPQEAAPGSIWPGERRANALFADSTAKFVGDVITVIIEEQSSGQNRADAATSRKTNHSAGIGGMTRIYPENPARDKRYVAKYELGGTSDSSLTGSGNTSRDGELQAIITAQVVDVLANGNLVIEGRRQLTVNEEDQYIVISGIVRPEDVSEDNIVSSRHIAQARIVYTGKGIIHDKMRPGWLTRVVDWVWPF
ncbi:MAG TPA: flagellar basal body L-ring protein FlgH [Deltaproteobacteria bacterium]|nr:flagellar basal body L-ring protein FlgH [Deltaproteobacteria bacterium]